jgi:cytidine deaminase
LFSKILFTTALLFTGFAMAQETTSLDVIEMNQKMVLVQKAAEACSKAYAPYSKFHVGCALLASDGTIFQGANIENASYGVACCAERVTLFKAISEGHFKFDAIAVVVPGVGTPCGICRQALNEFEPNLLVLIGDTEGNLIKEMTLSQLLPDAFGPHNLEKNK